MADTIIEIQEVRFNTTGELNECYVFVANLSNDGMLGVQGWHFKAFPPNVTLLDVMTRWKAGEEDPLLWPLQGPTWPKEREVSRG